MDWSILTFLAAPIAAALIIAGIHAYLGLHVVERGVIFVDLSLAQIASLGAAIAVWQGSDPHSATVSWMSLGFTLSRVLFGHLPDRIGGARVALVCVMIEAAGQALIWLAPWPALALLGAALTGFGYSLVYPGFGVEAVRRAPPESRGLAMGAYTACLDLALGLANPALGLVASAAGLSAVFLVSTLVVLCASVVALRLLQHGGSAMR